jgi:twitching motility protein PilT
MDLTELLAFVVKNKASDLHLSSGLPPMIRVHGDVRRINVDPLEHKQVHDMVYDIMNDAQRKHFEDTLECDFSFEIQGLARFRVNAFNQNRGAAAVFRTIPSKILTLEQLNTPKIFAELSLKPRGLVLVTGITGSGKSTALAAMVNHINRHRRVNIITIEDPIEFLHRDAMSNISQREVGSDTLSFATALRHVLRQDPDVILIGEIRDQETLDTALKAADTGHLVFSTLHTTDATQSINRVLSFYPPHQHIEIRSVLSTALAAICSLRLVPRSDGRGRVPACEVLINTAAVAENIRDVAKALNIPDLIAEGAMSYRMQNFDQSLMAWYKAGAISYESALFYASNPSEFALRASGISSSSDHSLSNTSGLILGGDRNL